MPKLICSKCKRVLRRKLTSNIPSSPESSTYLQTSFGLFTVSSIELNSSTALQLEEIPAGTHVDTSDLETILKQLFGDTI